MKKMAQITDEELAAMKMLNPSAASVWQKWIQKGEARLVQGVKSCPIYAE
jgi:hypothetical protein